MGEDRGREGQVDAGVLRGEHRVDLGDPSALVVLAVPDVDVGEAHVPLAGEPAAADGDAGLGDVEAEVASFAAQDGCELDRNPAVAAADIQHPVVGLQSGVVPEVGEQQDADRLEIAVADIVHEGPGVGPSRSIGQPARQAVQVDEGAGDRAPNPGGDESRERSQETPRHA